MYVCMCVCVCVYVCRCVCDSEWSTIPRFWLFVSLFSLYLTIPKDYEENGARLAHHGERVTVHGPDEEQLIAFEAKKYVLTTE
jgi:hypothetical protein